MTVPFVLQLVGTLGLMSFLSYRSSLQGIEALAYGSMQDSGAHLIQDLDRYLQSAHRLNQSNMAALKAGVISLDNLDQLHRYLILQHQQYPEITSMHLGTPAGEFRLVHRVTPQEIADRMSFLLPSDFPYEAGRSNGEDPSQLQLYAISQSGELIRPIETVTHQDVRDQPWYHQAVETGSSGWSKPFQIGAKNLLAINAYNPFYSPGGQLLGIFSANISLDWINQLLNGIKISTDHYVFIVERSGNLIATSSTEDPIYEYSLLEHSRNQLNGQVPAVTNPNNILFQRISAKDSSNPMIQAAINKLNQNFDSLEIIQSTQLLSLPINGDHCFISAIPYRDMYGLDWLIISIVPRSNFIDKAIEVIYRNALICLFVLLGSVWFGFWFSKKISRPLLRLKCATQAFIQHHSLHIPATSKICEIESLSQAFVSMIRDLQRAESFQRLYQETLECQVAEKTQALLASKAELQLITDSIPACISYVGTDRRYRFVNHAYEVWFNLNKDQIIGKHVWEVIGSTGYKKVEEYLDRVLAGETVSYEGKILYQGKKIRYISVVLIPDHDENQAVQGYYALFTDISAQKQIEQSLQILKQAVDAAQNSILIVDAQLPDMPITYVNPAVEKLTGYSALELYGKNCRVFQKEDRDQLGILKLREAIQDGKECRALIRNYRKNGSMYWNDITISPIHDSSGQITHYVGIQQDVTDQQLVERRKEEFLATVSHELRTPLTSVQGLLSLLAAGQLGSLNEMGVKLFNSANADAQRLTRLINEILDLESIRLGHSRLQCQWVQTFQILENLLLLMQPLAEQAHIQIETEISASQMWTDPDRILQVLINLVGNAIKYASSGGLIQIKAEQNKDSILWQVRDWGTGIPPQNLNTIFQPFQRLDSSLSGDRKGSGLGLTICRQIVEAHDGEIWVESTLGQGSAFCFRIPAKNKQSVVDHSNRSQVVVTTNSVEGELEGLNQVHRDSDLSEYATLEITMDNTNDPHRNTRWGIT
ncbi:MAG: PAS domain S-box protein [Synechococcaceae cyanobacterium SM2_3_1]|nr:PAS domain S-box protein [Synechococcaceae cyanobacterium SM2_3_1]